MSLLDLLEQSESQSVQSVDQLKLFNLYLSQKAAKHGIPIHGMLELTPLCNLNCKMCYVHLTQEQLGKRSLLNAAQWKELIHQAVDSGMIQATLTGGECLTHPDFDEIYLYLHTQGVLVTILTNGVLLTEERVRFFKAHPPKSMQVTLYGENDDTYESVTGRRCHTAVMQGIRRVIDAGIPLSISITPNRFLPDGGEALLRYVHSLGIPYMVNTSLTTPYPNTGRQNDDIDLDTDGYIRLHLLRYALNGRPARSIDTCELPLPPESGKKSRGLLCTAGNSSFAINWDGRMLPCGSFQSISAHPLREGFAASWQTIRAAVNNYPLPEECTVCLYRNICPACVLLHKQDAPIGHASPRQCARARAFVQYGLATPLQE